MAEGFRWTRRGYLAQLEPAEARLLRGLLRDVIALLESRRQETESAEATASEADRSDPFWEVVSGLGDLTEGTVRTAPQEPALARLLPSALTDPAADAEHRALSEDSLVQAKLTDAQRALAQLQTGAVRLDEDEAVHFSRALNDVRLVLATRLGIEDEATAARVHDVDSWLEADDLESMLALLYNFTSWLLETLMDQMAAGLSEDGIEAVPGEEPPSGASGPSLPGGRP